MRFKTKEEFIQAVMAGRKFEFRGDIYCYQNQYTNPFRFRNQPMDGTWDYTTTKEFTEIIEPRTEERWIMRRDGVDMTVVSHYVNQAFIEQHYKAENGWYKCDSITVALKDNLGKQHEQVL